MYQSATRHYSDPICKVVSFIHEMCSQQNDTIIFIVFEHFPNVSPG